MKKESFTLVEVLISATILTIIATALLTVLIVADMSWRSDMGLLELQQQTRQSLYAMVREMREIDGSINLPTSDDIRFSIIDDITNTTPPYPTYSLRYFLDSTNDRVIRETPVGTNCEVGWNSNNCKVLANDITGLRFQCLGGCANPKGVQVDINATKNVRGRTFTFNLTEQITIR
ncbi:MAG: type II secretion system protein [Candidatus Omnitrophota bacterium]|nr:MAG: type II secretion system protein [Candidatus Omnitrophota bacterium]